MINHLIYGPVPSPAATLDSDRILSRPTRFVITTALGIALGAEVTTITTAIGIGASAQISASKANDRVDDVQQELERQSEFLEKVNHRLDLAYRGLRTLNNQYVTLNNRVDDIVEEMKQNRDLVPQMTFFVSYLVARFVVGAEIIKDTIRQWLEGDLNPAFLDYLNYTSPCTTCRIVCTPVPAGCPLIAVNLSWMFWPLQSIPP